VKTDLEIRFRELPYQRSLVRATFPGNDVGLPPERTQGDDLLQNGDEVPAGAASGGFSVNAFQCGLESPTTRYDGASC
jgi:hypothetical protein